MSTFIFPSSGEEVDPLWPSSEHLQCEVHASHKRSGNRLLLRRRRHLLHPHRKESRVQSAVSVHLPLRHSLRGAEWPCCSSNEMLLLLNDLFSDRVYFIPLRLWLYQMIPTLSCRVGRTEQCGGLTFAQKPAALKKTARMYADNWAVFNSSNISRKLQK